MCIDAWVGLCLCLYEGKNVDVLLRIPFPTISRGVVGGWGCN